MLISDLKKSCKNCSGMGFKLGFEEIGSLQTNLKKSCKFCYGRGYLLTELGQNLWDLYLPMIRQLIQETCEKK